ncbi:MAG: biotin synthase BioB [Deltaproteobacteria bacterium]|nr:biotin synthase BioB [Deltaproteobacteria bacterium]
MNVLCRLRDKAIQKKELTFDDALILYEEGRKNIYLLLAYSWEIARHFKGNSFEMCMILNAKSGLCVEDCKFCAQSIHYQTPVETYPLLSKEEILRSAKKAKEEGASMFSIVTSGPSIEREEEWNTILASVTEIKKLGLNPCASLGMIDELNAKSLKQAGLFRYHHNLETSREYFAQICTTHSYEDKIRTIENVKKVGLSVCSGGIIGMGEKIEDRIKLALELRDLDVDSVPINILNPRPGTPLETISPISPQDVILTISVFRFLLPDKDIRLCAGREIRLRQLLPLGIIAGCNGVMTGNYLTTGGRSPELDRELIYDLGLELKNTFLCQEI